MEMLCRCYRYAQLSPGGTCDVMTGHGRYAQLGISSEGIFRVFGECFTKTFW